MEFINGVEVLNKVAIEERDFQWSAIPIILGLFAIGCLVFGIVFAIREYDASPFGLGIFCAVISCVFVWATGTEMIETGNYEYKVIIHDDVSLNDFSEKYEIVEQEGRIYTIRIKDDN